ncbi:MAG: TIGR02147 family protein [Oligoflexia bacterium]|nr:TIGR02147 family protein [Oligoflexia bacterium]
MLKLFQFSDYRKYLNSYFSSSEQGCARGARAALAKALGCQQSYLSLILSGKAHLSPEQAHEASRHFGHNKVERRYFLLLVLHGRAGQKAFKDELEKELFELKNTHLRLKNRVELRQPMTYEKQSAFYSHWYYLAVQMALTVPGLNTAQAIAHRFGLPSRRVNQILAFLVEVGLAERRAMTYRALENSIHVGHDSPLVARHHTNWRVEAIKSLDREDSSDFHYSSVITISRTDEPKIREILLKAIEDIRGIVRNSPEEDLFCYNVDLFGLGRS